MGILIFASVVTHRIRSELYAAGEDLIAVSVEGEHSGGTFNL